MGQNIISNFQDLIDLYDLFLFDLWGVIHDGNSIYSGALDTLKTLKKLNKEVHFISNGPRRSSMIRPVLENFGITSDLYSGITSSGDACYHTLTNNRNYGNKYFFIGLDKDLGMLDDLGYQETRDINDADFILAHGYYGDIRNESISDNLIQANKRNIPMICVNPDITVIHMGKTLFCAGKIAAEYKEMGGRIVYFGKPYQEIYDIAVRQYNYPKSKIMAVGDSFYTDILGANQFKIDSCLVTQGIFHEKIGKDLNYNDFLHNFNELVDKYNAKPNYIIHGF